MERLIHTHTDMVAAPLENAPEAESPGTVGHTIKSVRNAVAAVGVPALDIAEHVIVGTAYVGGKIVKTGVKAITASAKALLSA